YYKDQEMTKQSIKDGWLHTQDLGYMDQDGFLYIVERKQHMIISGGENIYPKEVEDVLCCHPKILETAVFGVPDKIWGQNVCAAVVLKQAATMSEEEVIDYCRSNIASFKKPKKVIFLSKLPRNEVRKVLRTELKKMI
ncbi:MAG TPA: acyl-CoA synthetase, partial [Thermodesulforhabdus norvegica]|nr:acyl-CoA synthetase [Thermodesulforhabdus norvegica]